MSVLFGFDLSSAHDWVHRLLPILETALGKKQALPERKIDSIEGFLTKFAEVQEGIIDGTERPVQRPKDGERQIRYCLKMDRKVKSPLCFAFVSQYVFYLFLVFSFRLLI
jgi:hypothetical protein